MNKNIMDYETVALDEDGKGILIIDQTLLPGRTQIIRLETAKEIWEAIYLLKVRGAPAIGVTAAFGLSVLARQIAEEVGAENGKAIEAEMKKGSEIEGQKGEGVAFAAFYEKFKEQKDYQDGSVVTVSNGTKSAMELSGSNVLRYEMADGTSLIVRPSGTEPKVKVYILANGESKEACDAKVEKYAAWAEGLKG